MEKEEKTISIQVNNLIALCHILNDYDEFTKNLTRLIKEEDYSDIVYNLCKISNGHFVVGSKIIKRFYKDNKSVIDIINKFYSIGEFINDCYGNSNEESSVDFFYKYITNHQKDLERILSLLEQINKLGFDRLEFNEELDFTNNEYKIYTKLNENFSISYLDNMEAIPNYRSDIVEYRTTGSNYEIVADVSLGDISKCELSKYGKKITVNSLLFDYKKLPEDITKEFTFDRIVSLKKEKQEECDSIRNSVDLSIGVDDLYSQYDITSKIIESLKNVESKEQLHEVLLEIKPYLEQLQSLSSKYDDSVVQNDSPITREKLQEEKRLYLERRNRMKYKPLCRLRRK
ncbi:MAG: hypothetical protein VZS44_01410 [Bacilli bacterium]|nr:hypothetical protein [Bacilli bacterium]